jgi:hypothetical protein
MRPVVAFGGSSGLARPSFWVKADTHPVSQMQQKVATASLLKMVLDGQLYGSERPGEAGSCWGLCLVMWYAVRRQKQPPMLPVAGKSFLYAIRQKRKLLARHAKAR